MGTKRRINKLFYSMLIPLVSCTLANNFLIVSSTQIHAYADELIDDFESSIMASRHTPTIADDFKDNRIIVTLKSQYSEVNSRANIQSFRTSDRSLAFEAVEDLTFITDTSKIINKDGFSQIFSITL